MAEERRTRLHALVPGGSANADQPMALDSLVSARIPVAQATGLPQEWQQAVSLCQDPVWVAEIAARMGLPLSTVATLLSELVARDLVHHQPSTTKARTPDVHILQRVKRGLMAI